MTGRTVGKNGGELLVRGSLLKLRRRCGKENCRCAEGDPHESWVISYSVGGRTRMLPVADEKLAQVREALSAYRRALAELERQAMAGIERLRGELSAEKRR